MDSQETNLYSLLFRYTHALAIKFCLVSHVRNSTTVCSERISVQSHNHVCLSCPSFSTGGIDFEEIDNATFSLPAQSTDNIQLCIPIETLSDSDNTEQEESFCVHAVFEDEVEPQSTYTTVVIGGE